MEINVAEDIAAPPERVFDVRPQEAMKLVFPLMSPMVRRELKQYASFKEFCEQPTS